MVEEIRREEMGATRVTRDKGIAVVATLEEVTPVVVILGEVTVVAEGVVLVEALVEVHRVVAIPGEGGR